MNKKIKKYAEEIITLEREIYDLQEKKLNISDTMEKIEKILNSLSLEEIFEMDEYIMKTYPQKVDKEKIF